MMRPIVEYDQDDQKDWVAVLECGHLQHVRHHPPLTSRPWVLTEQGRDSMLGTVLNCVRCDNRELPQNLEAIRVATFDQSNIPSALLSKHQTKGSIWGILRIHQGALEYKMHEPFNSVFILTASELGIIIPGVLHEVRATEQVSFALELYRVKRLESVTAAQAR